MTREELIEAMARAMCVNDEQDPDAGTVVLGGYMPDRPMWKTYERSATAALAAIEAAGVRLVYPSEARAQLIDGDERTTVTIFTPYAPPNPGAITGIRKAETPCSDCIDGWCQMNCGPRLT